MTWIARNIRPGQYVLERDGWEVGTLSLLDDEHRALRASIVAAALDRFDDQVAYDLQPVDEPLVGELLSTGPRFVELADGVFVNPDHVASIEPRDPAYFGGEAGSFVQVGRRSLGVNLTVAEVIARLTAEPTP
jgi:hypothetical protein